MSTFVPRKVLVRILVEYLLAAGRAEVIGLVATKRAVFGRPRVDHHSADRIDRRPSAFHIVSLPSKGLMSAVHCLTDQRPSPDRVPRGIALEDRATASGAEVVRLAAEVSLLGGGGGVNDYPAHRVSDQLCTRLRPTGVCPQHFDSAGSDEAPSQHCHQQ